MTESDPPNADAADRSDAADGLADTDAVHAGETVSEELLTDRRTLDARVRWKWSLRALVVAVVLAVVVGLVSAFVLEWGLLPAVGTFIVAFGLSLGHALALYRSWVYRVREDALYLERGVLTHVKTVVPFVRVQHIDTSRDPVDRALGLSSLIVYTAGSRGADVTVPGLTPEEATDLQERLKVLAKDATGDDAV
ncbi:MAG: PH domain-containing protein [Halorhabdus sp.]